MDHNAGVSPVVAQRPLSMIAREAFRGSNWVALARMRGRYPDLLESARRYFGAGGAYPWACRVRTPLGVVAPVLHGPHDMFTVNEVLERVLDDAPAIDVLKVDTEGAEAATVRAIRPDLLARVRRIYLETSDPAAVRLDDFEARFSSDTLALTNRTIATHDAR